MMIIIMTIMVGERGTHRGAAALVALIGMTLVAVAAAARTHGSQSSVHPRSLPPTPSDKPQVTLLYESLCDGCQDEILTAFKNVFEFRRDVFDLMDLQMMPHGWAKPDGKGGYNCQHGPDECTLNYIESCAMHTVNFQPDLYFDFILCIEVLGADALKGNKTQECAELGNIDYKALEKCLTSPTKMELADKSEIVVFIIHIYLL